MDLKQIKMNEINCDLRRNISNRIRNAQSQNKQQKQSSKPCYMCGYTIIRVAIKSYFVIYHQIFHHWLKNKKNTHTPLRSICYKAPVCEKGIVSLKLKTTTFMIYVANVQTFCLRRSRVRSGFSLTVFPEIFISFD